MIKSEPFKIPADSTELVYTVLKAFSDQEIVTVVASKSSRYTVAGKIATRNV